MKIVILIFLASFIPASKKTAEILSGSWQLKSDSSEQVLIFEDGYFTHTDYNKAFKEFHFSRGGTTDLKSDSLFIKLEFHSAAKDEVGKTITSKISFNEGELITNWNGVPQKWIRTDRGGTPLAGYWRISGRLRGDKMVEIKPSARKTIKILSGTRFQWAAINTETKEFFGTGGECTPSTTENIQRM